MDKGGRATKTRVKSTRLAKSLTRWIGVGVNRQSSVEVVVDMVDGKIEAAGVGGGLGHRECECLGVRVEGQEGVVAADVARDVGPGLRALLAARLGGQVLVGAAEREALALGAELLGGLGRRQVLLGVGVTGRELFPDARAVVVHVLASTKVTGPNCLVGPGRLLLWIRRGGR